MTHPQELLSISAAIEASASVSLSKERAVGLCGFWRSLSNRLQALNTAGAGKASEAASHLSSAIQKLCEKQSIYHSPVALIHGDFLMKTASALIQSYLAFLHQNATTESPAETESWQEWFSRFELRVERMVRDGEHGNWAAPNEYSQEQNAKAKKKVLKWIQELTQKIQDQSVIACQIKEEKRRKEAALQKIKNFTVFRVSGRRFAVPSLSAQCYGPIQGFYWLTKSVPFREGFVPLVDARKSLGISGPAGTTYVVFVIAPGQIEAWAVDGVEPMPLQYNEELCSVNGASRRGHPVYLLNLAAFRTGCATVSRQKWVSL